jgi:hypothetical protein
MLSQRTPNQRTRHNPYINCVSQTTLNLRLPIRKHAPICAVPIRIPVYNGLFSLSTLVAIILNAPFTMPLIPSPATALPIISAMLLGATPHIKLPSSNRNTKARYTNLLGNKV